jgi:ABC-type amino acid transport substrate-binding protein
LLILIAAPVPAVEEMVVRVGTHEVPPFVVRDAGNYSGFEHDLREAVADSLNWRLEYVYYESSADLRGATKRREVDMGSAAITKTSEREASGLDLSHSLIHTGFSVLVFLDEGTKSFWDHMAEIVQFRNLRAFGKALVSSALTEIVLAILLIIIVGGHLLFWFQPKEIDTDIPDKWPAGALAAMYYLATIVISGEVLLGAKSFATRTIVILSMVIGVVVVSNFIAILAADYTLAELEHAISRPADLRGKDVATKAGTTSEDLLRFMGARVHVRDEDGKEITSISETYPMLEDGRAEAVLYDSPALLYKAKEDPRFTVTLTFGSQDFGLAFPEGSELVGLVNRALLRMKESGDYRRIYEEWFGPMEMGS